MIIDTHAHFDDKAFAEDREGLLTQLSEHGIFRVINSGASLEGCKRTIELTEKYDFIYGTLGIHPCDCGELTEEDIQWIKEKCALEKIVAVGEIGLDYYWDDTEREVQRKWFARQMLLAKELKLPMVIHSREAALDTITMMKEHNAQEAGGVIHCYSYTKESAREFLDMGFYFGIGGVVTFRNAKKLKEAVEYIPMDRILTETDSPYLAPVPNRGKRNDSRNLPYVVAEIARVKGLTTEEVEAICMENAHRLYQKLK